MQHFALTGEGDVALIDGELRIRIGDKRIFFEANRETETIRVVRVLPRDKAYKKND